MTKKEITQLSYEITGCAIKVHKERGPGLLESIYEKCLKIELEKNGFQVMQQMNVPVIYDGVYIDCDLRLDLIVNNIIVIEVKAVQEILPVHEAQLLTYMKLLNAPYGLLFNFYSDNLSKNTNAMVNDIFRKLPD